MTTSPSQTGGSPSTPGRYYRFLRAFLRFLFRLLTRLDIQGLERTPMEGPVLMASNHTSIYEAPLILAVTPRPRLTALAKEEYRNSAMSLILRGVDPVYVSRGEVDRTALKEVLRRLKNGEAVGIAPEGTRSRTGTLIEGKEGAAYLALQTDAWLLPIAVWGQEKLFSDLLHLHRPTIHMRVGHPFKLQSDPTKHRAENIAAGTTRLMHAIATLLPPERRGVYAEEVVESFAG